MTNLRRVAVVVALIAAGVSCGERRSDIEAREESERAAFCDAITKAIASADEGAVRAALDHPPVELADAAEVLRAADTSLTQGSLPPKVQAATAEVFGFTQDNCSEGRDRKLAPPPDAPIEGLTLCGATAEPTPATQSDRSGMVLYGDTTLPDPYDGPMIGLLWHPVGDSRYTGSRTAVTVRAQEGLAAPITDLLGKELPELGTVVAWTEGERDIGVYGRGWSLDRVQELVEMANGIEEIDTRLQLQESVLPARFGLVYAGFPSAAELTTGALYSIRYRGGGGTVLVSGVRLREADFSAFRFFTLGIDQAVVAGRPGLAGNASGDEGPAVVTWREPDGLVVRVIGLGASLDVVEKVAAATRELSEEEWAAVSRPRSACATP